MADTKITALTALTGADPANDVIPIVDVSDTTMAASGTTKKISVNNILGASGTATLASATITGDLTVDTNTLKVTASTDTVTVGATTTDAKFRVVDASYNGLRIGFLPGTANYNLYDATVHEFRTASVTPQQLYTLQASSSVWYDGAGGTRMTLNATGLGVGVSPAAKFDSLVADAAESARFRAASGWLRVFGYVDATDKAKIQATNNTNTALQTLTLEGLTVRFNTNGGTALNLNANGAAALLGASTSANGVGITFPATQSASSDANTLDDYEEGTFTPNIAGTTPTYTTQIGRYTKIGNRVFVTIRLTINNAGDGEDYRISGLPFANSSAAIAAISVGYFANLKSAAAFLSGYINLSASQIVLTATTGSALTATNGFGGIGNSTDLAISAVYFV